MKRLILALLMLSAPAMAQEASYSIQLSPADMNYLGEVLGEEPFKTASPLLTKMQQQITEQNAKREAALREQIIKQHEAAAAKPAKP